jgi:hypothetical protein
MGLYEWYYTIRTMTSVTDPWSMGLMGSMGIFCPILGTFGAIRKTSRSIPEYISVDT